jgi:hypothetical protein
MKKLLVIFAICLSCCWVSADYQLAVNNSFETVSLGEPTSWWNYNDTPATGETNSSTAWRTNGARGVHMRLLANADPIWLGYGQGITITPFTGTDLRRLYVCANVSVVSLQNAHVKLEVKLLKRNGTGFDYAMVKEAKAIVTGRQTLSVNLDLTELKNMDGTYYVVVGVVLGSEYVVPMPDASGEAYADEVYVLGTYTRNSVIPLVPISGVVDVPFTKSIFQPAKKDIAPYYERLSAN